MNGDRRFLVRGIALAAATGLLLFLWPLLSSMTPAADVRAPTIVDLSTIAPGERRTVLLPRRAIFVLHRTPEQIATARADDDAQMPSPQPDSERVQRAEWLVVVAKPDWGWQLVPGGEYDGWFEVHTATRYDLSGRVREGWRNTNNLPVPAYYFLNDTTLVIE